MKKDFTADLLEARKKQISRKDNLKAEEYFQIIQNAMKTSDPIAEALVMVYRLGYSRGQAAQKRARRAKITAAQADTIQDLYTDREIRTLLKRLKKDNLKSLNQEEALELIEKRPGIMMQGAQTAKRS